MLDCLVNYVGIKGCGETAPGSGLYINSLPGIPRELLDKIATADQGTYKQAWLDIQNNAVQELAIELSTAFASRYKIRSLLRSFSLGKDIDTSQTTAIAAVSRGFSVDLHKNLPEGYVRSNMLAFSIDSLELYLQAVTAVDPIDILILDGDTGETLFTYSLAIADQVTGWNVIPVNRLLYAGKIVAVYSCDEAVSTQLTLPLRINDSLCGCMQGMYDECLGDVKGVVYSGDVTTMTEGVNTYGLTANVSLTCTFEKLICRNKMLFAKPLQFLLGSKVMEAALYTNRFGRFNTTDRKVTEGLMEDYKQDFLSSIGLVLKGMDLDLSDPCIVCDPSLYTTYVHP